MKNRRNSTIFKTFVIGITGSVASGKSTFASILAKNIDQKFGKVLPIVNTDDFLFENAKLDKLGIMHEKGFPHSHNSNGLRSFIESVKANEENILKPKYSHSQYNLLTDKKNEVIYYPYDVCANSLANSVNVLILEGVGLSEVRDLIDYLIFYDTPISICYERYLKRAMKLRSDGSGYFKQFANITTDEFIERASKIWQNVNLKNYNEHILPLRYLSDFIMPSIDTIDRTHM